LRPFCSFQSLRIQVVDFDEVGREVKRDKNGVVVDKKAINSAMLRFEDACELKKWYLVKKSPSMLSGKDGNLEYCYYFTK